jgi:hypothetical protein
MYAMHRTMNPSPPEYNDFRLWLGAKTVLLGEGKVSPSDCRGAASLPFLLEKLEELGHGEFIRALRHLEKLNTDWEDIWRMKYQLQRWYTTESKNKYNYVPYRKLKPRAVKKMKASCKTPALQLTIPRPANGVHYTNEEAIAIIQRYPKGSNERGRVRQMMVARHFVSSRSTFCRHVKRFEDSEEATKKPKPARSVIDPREVGLGYEGDYIRENIRHVVKWKGRIVLPLIPVSFQEIEAMHAPAPSHLANVDICAFIGNTDLVSKSEHVRFGNVAQDSNMVNDRNCVVGQAPNFAQLCEDKKLPALKWDPNKTRNVETGRYDKTRYIKRIARLYFSPVEYPPPAEGKRDNILCGHLRNHIEKAAEEGHSPVVCIGGNNYEKQFRCKHWYRRRKTPDSEKLHVWRPYNIHSCTFCFVMKWDRYGYYIPLLQDSERSQNMGCAWHCCPETNTK